MDHSLIIGSICSVDLAGLLDISNNTISLFDKACYNSWDYFKGGITTQISNDTKELINYWLYGTAIEPNWFDKACYDSLDYFKDICSTAPVISKDGTCEELVVVTNKAQENYLVLGLSYLLIACAIFANIHYNFDMLKATYTIIDQRLYDILCMFDFPGFMVERRSTMPLGEGYELVVEHFWNFIKDPADDNLGLTHLASYTLQNDNFWLQFNSLAPAWSVPSYLTLTIVPGLHWPFNYDHFHYITLFSF